jgi:hypothetical protein
VADHAAAGLGGFFIHARAGLRADYLGEGWRALLAEAIEAARAHGLMPWFYDEWGWPSGMTGGRIPAMGPEHQQKFLHMEESTAGEAAGADVLGVYTMEGDPVDPATLPATAPVLRARVAHNSAYVDILHPPSISHYIESTYEWHRRHFGEFLGGDVPGFFTDEPQFGRYAMPWSTDLPARFRARHGYDLMPHLAALARPVGDYRHIRHDFWQWAAEAMEEAYIRPLGEWCGRHGCVLTGHALLEEDARWQTICTGTAMGFYRHQQVPGIDWLGRRIGNVVIGKQVASVADQMGRRRVLSEMFAAGGWNVTPADLKWIAEWQYALGINLMCPHLEPVTIRGARKRDYPPFPFFQSPWWPLWRRFTDYFGRLSMLMATGRTVANILVIHPIRTAWMEVDEGVYRYNRTINEFDRSPELAEIDATLERLCTLLSAAHLDYHLGDEAMLRDMARVEDGALVLGDYRYTAIVLPSCGTLTESTVRLIGQLSDAGVALFRCGRVPDRVEGRMDPRAAAAAAMMQPLALEPHEVAGRVGAAAPPAVRLMGDLPRDRMAVLALAKDHDGARSVYIVNTDRGRGYDIEVAITGAASLEEVDLSTGEVRPAASRLHLAPGESRYLRGVVADAFVQPTRAKSMVVARLEGLRAVAGDLNVIPLDHCRWRDVGGEWSALMPTVQARLELLQGGRDRELELEYTVESAEDFHPDVTVQLIVEDSDRTTIHLNGAPVTVPKDPAWWIDTPLHVVPIAGMLRRGTNIIHIRLPFRNSAHLYEQMRRAANHEQVENMLAFDTEVEAVYIRGDFRVETPGETTATTANAEGHLSRRQAGPFRLLPGRIPIQAPADLTQQGYPFHRDSFIYTASTDLPPAGGSRVVLCLDRPNGSGVGVTINGRPVGDILWSPYELDITDHVQAGANDFQLCLYGTNRNLFGPHHHPMGDLYLMGPHQFEPGDGWDARYCLVPFGLNGTPRIEFR